MGTDVAWRLGFWPVGSFIGRKYLENPIHFMD
jgi:hypothetical protein